MEDKSKQALYRRYRSTSFDELVGQEHVTDLLKSAVENDSISHAYLFTGQRGTGKTSAARILAYAINDLPYDANTHHLDIIEIDAASNRRIDDIRELREKVFIAPVSAKYKVYIIDEVHMLTGESFNALLKTIEEPPAHAIFILATTELHKVPATIISRTQRFHFRPVAIKKVVDHHASIAKKENINIDEGSLKLIAEHGGGSFRDSISMLDQMGSIGGQITVEKVESILGRARSTDIKRIIELLADKNPTELHKLLNELIENGISAVTLSEQLTNQLLKNPVNNSHLYELTEKLMSIPKAHFPSLMLISTLMGFVADTPTPRTVDLPKSTPKTEATKHDDASEKVTAKSEKVPDKTDEATSIKDESVAPPADNSGAGFNWDNVLAATKKSNPALHSVLNRARVDYLENKLTLSFQYALHRKKLEQAQYRTQLSRVIQDVCGINPEVIITDQTTKIASDDPAKKVADLMGGGERVNV